MRPTLITGCVASGLAILVSHGSLAAQARYGENYRDTRRDSQICGASCGWAIDTGASFVLPRGVPTLTTPLTGAEPRDISDGIQGVYRQGRTGTTNKNAADILERLDREERSSYGAKRVP